MFFLGQGLARGQTVLSGSEAAKVLRLEDLNVTSSKISGTLINASPHTVRDIKVLIQYHWLWENERNPGKDSPGRTVDVDLQKELKPGDRVNFSYTPVPSLPQRSDGRFMPEVDVAGFTVVIPQQRAARS
jgi:hypothetical protein